MLLSELGPTIAGSKHSILRTLVGGTFDYFWIGLARAVDILLKYG